MLRSGGEKSGRVSSYPVVAATNRVWHWEKVDPDRLNASGNLAKAFKNEAPKAPGVFAQSRPSDEATLLVREAVQNSWDSALEMREELKESGLEVPPFEVRFRFRSVSGEDRENLVSALGLRELAERSATVDDESTLGIGSTECLDSLDRPKELRVLEVFEQGAGGMYGPWENAKSKLALALSSTGVTSARRGRGGSYGYGKAGLIRGSAVRTVVAYTCFAERDDDRGVTRRLLGMTYWDTHEFAGVSFVGCARMGDFDGAATRPLVNEGADEAAAALGLSIRDPSLPADRGSSFLLVDPTVDPTDLVTAVERNWWPALVEQSLDFNVVVEDVDGSLHHPRPRSDSTLGSFIDAYEVATVPQDNKRATVTRRTLEAIGNYDTPGVVGLVTGEWSYPEYRSDDPTDGHRSLVALVRAPRMVVEYLEAGRSAPYIRGCFVADDSVNEALRQTEPKGHDSWQTRASSGDFNDESAHLAKNVIGRIKNNLNDFRNKLKPPPKPAEAVRLPVFDRLLKALLSGGGASALPSTTSDRSPFVLEGSSNQVPQGRCESEALRRSHSVLI